MAYKRWRLWGQLTIASILAVAFTVMATLSFGQWIFFLSFSLLTICSFAWIFARFMNIRKNVAFVLDAVENNDLAFRYSTDTPKATDPSVNAYLNRLIDILERLTDDIREKDRYYEIILNSVDNGILIVGDDGVVTHSNLAARRMLQTDVISNLRHLGRVHPSLPHLLASDSQSLINLTLPQGEISLSVTRANLSLHNRMVKAIVLSDISRSMESKEQESWSKLTRVLTHEIMNSLTPVISICESLLTDSDATISDYKQGLSTVASTGHGLKRFVDSYRSFAHIPTPQPKPFYLKPFLERMRDLCIHQFPESSARISIVCKPDDLLLYADEHLIGLVVTNILKNAIQAIADTPSPEINIKANILPNEQIRIEISNNGPTISPEAASQIFLPFFTTKSDGNGIGLSIAKRIMSASNGSLSLRTLPKTTFILTFD